ncbi:DUF2235 domain-containing protein [Sedimentitalea sp.]|uniref:DUF2235 domain-containing protein n=1 Tax=Sedimentitalea sp. TaxID=2048915 RepID=UPI00329809B1
MPDRLIFCLDGTWNNPFISVQRDDGTTVMKPTNPLKLARAILPVDASGTRQFTYYDSGVGALGLYPGVSNAILQFVDSKLGGYAGAGFEANVEQAVTHLAQNYTPDAQIYIFGFSRGAAQTRALTRFLSWMGGVPAKSDAYYIPIFFRHYIAKRGKGSPHDITNTKGDDVPARRMVPLKVTFLGVWDTVMALGSRFRLAEKTSVEEMSFHVGTVPADCVLNVRQALAIDERRADFRPEIWVSAAVGQTLEQRWFAGAHGNVGGSYGNDGMANCALHWIVDEAKAQGLEIDEAFLKKYRRFSRDTLGDPNSLMYRLADTFRLKSGKGKRTLQGYPETANLSIDPSAIQRFCSDPADFPKTMTEPYRPEELVKIAKAHTSNPEAWIKSYGLNLETYLFPTDI